jgi:signal transduction histidine kinase
MLLNARRLDHLQLILLAMEDITERRRAEAGQREAYATLEARVQVRTQELAEANGRLQAEIAERQQVEVALRASEVQLRALASQLTMAEQAERRRISQILHDDLQQRLYGVRMLLQVVREETAAHAESELATYAQQGYDLLGDAIGLTRQLSVDLSPPVLQEEGLADMLQWLVTQMARMNGLQVAVQAAHNFRIQDADMRVLLFQCIRELLFNVVKHGQTDQATVTLVDGEDDHLLIQVSDAGQGFEVAAAEARHAGGFGLFSVRERLSLFGGRMTIDSVPGQGTRITLAVPRVSAPGRAS